jgi:hypothetical protein
MFGVIARVGTAPPKKLRPQVGDPLQLFIVSGEDKPVSMDTGVREGVPPGAVI